PGPVSYPDALAFMEDRAAAIRDGRESELVWLVEHAPLYTAGTSAKREDLLEPGRFPVFDAGRGGEYTYHGPGQRVAYVMLDLSRRGRDLRAFVCALEQWVIDTLARFNVAGERRPGRVGVWVDRSRHGGNHRPGQEDKIAAVGVRVRHWVSFHGISLNVDCDLEHYSGIVPCGIADHGVTSLLDLGITASMAEVDDALRATAGVLAGRSDCPV
ncbi:MAG: lipoyl(octanoyl) transferase LipB, partial [Sneathiellaceae bacterium]